MPGPGKAVCQEKSAAVNESGKPVALLMPLPSGPRKRVQSWAEAAPCRTTKVRRSGSFMVGSGWVSGSQGGHSFGERGRIGYGVDFDSLADAA